MRLNGEGTQYGTLLMIRESLTGLNIYSGRDTTDIQPSTDGSEGALTNYNRLGISGPRRLRSAAGPRGLATHAATGQAQVDEARRTNTNRLDCLPEFQRKF